MLVQPSPPWVGATLWVEPWISGGINSLHLFTSHFTALLCLQSEL